MKKSLLLAAAALAFSSVIASAQNYDNGNGTSMRAPAKAQHVARHASAKVLYDYAPASAPARVNSPVYIFGIAY
jgi:hypothetical protein